MVFNKYSFYKKKNFIVSFSIQLFLVLCSNNKNQLLPSSFNNLIIKMYSHMTVNLAFALIALLNLAGPIWH